MNRACEQACSSGFPSSTGNRSVSRCKGMVNEVLAVCFVHPVSQCQACTAKFLAGSFLFWQADWQTAFWHFQIIPHRCKNCWTMLNFRVSGLSPSFRITPLFKIVWIAPSLKFINLSVTPIFPNYAPDAEISEFHSAVLDNSLIQRFQMISR